MPLKRALVDVGLQALDGLAHVRLLDRVEDRVRRQAFRVLTYHRVTRDDDPSVCPGLFSCTPEALERQLRREETSFREIEEDVRRRFAIALVSESAAPLESVAMRCGFANLPAFSRAFRRWTGTPPSRFRRTSQELGSLGQAAAL